MTEGVATTEGGASADGTRIARAKLLAVSFPLGAMALSSFGNAVRGVPADEQGTLTLVLTLVMVFCAMAWVRADARQLGRSWHEWRLFIFFLSCIALPVWIVQSRGRRCLPGLGLYVVYLGALGTAGLIGAALGSVIRG